MFGRLMKNVIFIFERTRPEFRKLNESDCLICTTVCLC